MALSPAILTFGLLMLAAVGAAQADPKKGVCAAGPGGRFEFVSRQMGTLFRIVLYAPDADAAAAAARAAFARVTELNRVMSDYDSQSELRRLERPPAGTAVAVSAELFDLLERSQQLAAQSHGAFDVTLGPLVRLWREARKNRRLPTDAARAAASRASGFAKLRLQPESRTVTRLAPGMQFDLGGIAKGYAADEALAVLARRGLVHAMVAASGDLALGAAPPGTAGWKIELAPFGEPASEPTIVVAEHVGISTSGDAEQFVEIDGVRYSHIVDPATGLGLTARVAVTVIARNATRSDSLATACSVLAGSGQSNLAACVGDSARALVLWRDECGRIRREVCGTSPPGLKSNL
jgi:thiamine biosynthesis lipoprotein